MTQSKDLQRESLVLAKIKDLLIYLKQYRKISNRKLAQGIHYEENYLTSVRNGDRDGGEKLLHALESFYLLDNLKRIAEIDGTIAELQNEKLILQGQTVEKFYDERVIERTLKRAGGNQKLNDKKRKPSSGAGGYLDDVP